MRILVERARAGEILRRPVAEAREVPGKQVHLRSFEAGGGFIAGSEIDVAFRIFNSGYAVVYRDRSVELVLSRDGDVAAALPLAGVSATDWTPGGAHSAVATVVLPVSLEGTYDLGLRIVDPDAPGPQHSIRFANAGWCGSTDAENDGCPEGGMAGVHYIAEVAVRG